MTRPIYLLDSNVFIEAKNRYYRFNIFPCLWRWLDEQQKQGQLASISMVLDELVKGKDELGEWAKERKNSDWFLSVDDQKTQQAYRKIVEWLADQPFKPTAIDEFLDCCDPWLIAKASVIDATVITHETFDPNIKRKVKIPNVCRKFNVSYLDTFDMLEHLQAKF